MNRIEAEGLGRLLASLAERGYTLIGPHRDGAALMWGPIQSVEELPQGWTDAQRPGAYLLTRTDDSAYFGYAVGPRSLKDFLMPPRQLLWRAHGDNDGFRIEAPAQAAPRYAFIGVRACELAALERLDRIFLEGEHPDPGYQARRSQAFIVAVNCARPSGSCFCTSMGTGPKASAGYDIVLTEVCNGGGHYFVADAATGPGRTVLSELGPSEASEAECAAAEAVTREAESRMTRRMEAEGVRELLLANAEHSRWTATADRCLACGNCTMVCPTCFCATVEDTTSLEDGAAERHRVWDSCFTLDFSYIHGGSIRKSESARYRHWITHKLATWHDQFGSSGCVGCGRCITWCPVGIDITEEIGALRAGG